MTLDDNDNDNDNDNEIENKQRKIFLIMYKIELLSI